MRDDAWAATAAAVAAATETTEPRMRASANVTEYYRPAQFQSQISLSADTRRWTAVDRYAIGLAKSV